MHLPIQICGTEVLKSGSGSSLVLIWHQVRHANAVVNIDLHLHTDAAGRCWRSSTQRSTRTIGMCWCCAWQPTWSALPCSTRSCGSWSVTPSCSPERPRYIFHTADECGRVLSCRDPAFGRCCSPCCQPSNSLHAPSQLRHPYAMHARICSTAPHCNKIGRRTGAAAGRRLEPQLIDAKVPGPVHPAAAEPHQPHLPPRVKFLCTHKHQQRSWLQRCHRAGGASEQNLSLLL